MRKNLKNLNIQELQEDLLTNSDIHIAGVEYLILLRLIKTNITTEKYFGLQGHVSLFAVKILKIWVVLIPISLLIWKRLIFVGGITIMVE
jgi:hypothetical protein